MSQVLSADGMLTGYENLLLFARLHAIPRPQRRRRIMDSTVAIMHRGRIAAVGSPGKLKSEIGPAATLEDAFERYAVASDEDRAGYRDILQTRRTARRLG